MLIKKEFWGFGGEYIPLNWKSMIYRNIVNFFCPTNSYEVGYIKSSISDGDYVTMLGIIEYDELLGKIIMIPEIISSHRYHS